MKRKILILLLISSQLIFAKKILSITIPKGGTHLLAETMMHITGKKPQSIGLNVAVQEIDDALNSLASDRFIQNHLYYSGEKNNLLEKHDVVVFLMIRDPRDEIISNTYYTREFYLGPWEYTKGLTFDENIMELIVGGSGYKKIIPHANNIDAVYRSFIPWLNNPRVCCIRFEDLVGARGGGSDQKQYECIKKIAEHLDINLSDDQINCFMPKIFGKNTAGMSTFRSGKIGAWKTHFNKEHIKAFKDVAGQLLIDLGYEESFDW